MFFSFSNRILKFFPVTISSGKGGCFLIVTTDLIFLFLFFTLEERKRRDGTTPDCEIWSTEKELHFQKPGSNISSWKCFELEITSTIMRGEKPEAPVFSETYQIKILNLCRGKEIFVLSISVKIQIIRQHQGENHGWKKTGIQIKRTQTLWFINLRPRIKLA